MRQNRVCLTVFSNYTPFLTLKTALNRDISNSYINYVAFRFSFKLKSPSEPIDSKGPLTLYFAIFYA
jgi:hypothetical protein